MPAYGDNLDKLSQALQGLLPEGQRDWSVDAAYYLALANLALRQLKDTGVQTDLKGRPLVVPALEQAYRELLYIRLNHVPGEMLENDVERPVLISRAGKLDVLDQTSIPTERRRDGDPNPEDRHRAGHEATGRPKWLRARRTAKLGRPKNAGSSTDRR